MRFLKIVCLAAAFATLPALAAPQGEREWLGTVFLAQPDCAPRFPLYSEPGTRSSIGRTLERRGYRWLKDEEWVTTLLAPADARFAGHRVLRLAIPNAEMSVYAITVMGSPEALAGAIAARTGRTLRIMQGEPARKSGEPYIVAAGPGQSSFVCFSFEEGTP